MNPTQVEQLRQANERLIVSALQEKSLAEAAMQELDAFARAAHRRALKDAETRHLQKLESIGVLAGGIAHDLNNVLAGILGNIALASDELNADHRASAPLLQAKKAAEHGRRVVRQILDFARKRPELISVVELNPLVGETMDLLRSTLPAQVTLRSSVAAESLSVLGDATQLSQVLLNLCTNSWHSFEGGPGTITVLLEAVRLSAPRARRIGHLTGGAYAHLAVTDNGSGMTRDVKARVFEPFFTTKAVDKGTGLGLSVAHGIVMAHAGAITVKSCPGSGSTFDIYLPLQKTGVPRGGDCDPPLAALGNGEHVLYIDDDEVMLLLVQRLLQRAGYRATCYSNGLDAMAAMHAQPLMFDALVTDLNMPGISGIEIVREALRIRPDLPIMLTSGNIPNHLYLDARELGVRALLEKQNTLEQLGPLLHLILSGGAQASQP